MFVFLCYFYLRLFTVLYFSVRSPRSHASSQNGRHLCLFCERNLERGRQSTEGSGVGDMRVGGCDARKIDARPTLPDTRPLGGLSSFARMASVLDRGDLTEKQRTVNSLFLPVLSGHPWTETKPHVILCSVLVCLKCDPSSLWTVSHRNTVLYTVEE